MNKTDKERLNASNMFHYESHFEPLPGFRTNYKYTIKVWLITILLGTSLFFAFKSFTEMFSSEDFSAWGGSTIFYYIIAIALALILSIPSVVLFALGYSFISGFVFSSTKIKLALFIIGQALCWLSFLIAFGLNNGEAIIKNLDVILPYAIANAVSIFICRLSSDR